MYRSKKGINKIICDEKYNEMLVSKLTGTITVIDMKTMSKITNLHFQGSNIDILVDKTNSNILLASYEINYDVVFVVWNLMSLRMEKILGINRLNTRVNIIYF